MAGLDALRLQIERIGKVRPIIVKRHYDTGATHGQMRCPICDKGVLTWSVAKHRNKHVRAACDTPNCISWME
jgi:hypothetical protein